MKAARQILTGAGLGAGLMYLLDPSRGARRRGLLRDQLTHASCASRHFLGTAMRDLRNRMIGFGASARSRVFRKQADDVVLIERVRAGIGRRCSHPGSIDVAALKGRVTLSGPILSREADSVVSVARAVSGVHRVEDRLERYATAAGIAGLQGGTDRRGDRAEYLQANWAPAPRLFAMIAGGALAAAGLRQRGPYGAAAALCGGALALRAATNLPLKRITGFGAGRRSVYLQKDINIAAPVEEVFSFWSNVENFPSFMAHVLDVRDVGEGRSHWTIAGPGNTTLEWDAELTRYVPNSEIAWKTIADRPFGHAGIIHFRPNDQGGTQMDVKMSYNPPAGLLGHSLAWLLGSDPKHALDADLARMKTYIETGRPPHDAAIKRKDSVKLRRESGRPGGGAGRRDVVKGSGVYPASGPLPKGEAEVRTPAGWGQGARGPEGYFDHGDSEIHVEGALGGD